MNPDMDFSIGQLDDHISIMRATLSDLRMELMNNENGRFAFAQLHEKANLEREIQQKRTLLHYLVQDQALLCWYFKRLPPEMQVEICKWVTNPEDQLNLLELFPSLGPLMHWDEGVLYFKMVYPLIKPYLKKKRRDLWRLCQVSPGLMDVVLAHFDLDLWSKKNWSEWTSSVPLYRVSTEKHVRNLVRSCEQLGRAPWMANMPFLCVIQLKLPDHGLQVPEFVTRFLETHGEKVWGLQVIANNPDHPPTILYALLHGILATTPNLVHLKLDNTIWNRRMNPQPLPNRFPELPRLRYLDSTSPLTQALAENYAPTLKSLKSWWNPPFPLNAYLAQLENYNTYFSNAIDIDFPGTILGCPLQRIHLMLGLIDSTASHIPKLLETLTHFQNTLEKLEVCYIYLLDKTDPALLAADKSWMLRVKLPKLRLLLLDRYRGNLDWLILFPSLNSLTLNDYSPGTDAERQGYPDILRFPHSQITRYSTNAFAYLRNLQEIKVRNGWREQLVVRPVPVKREEHAQDHNDDEKKGNDDGDGGFWARISSFLPFRHASP